MLPGLFAVSVPLTPVVGAAGRLEVMSGYFGLEVFATTMTGVKLGCVSSESKPVILLFLDETVAVDSIVASWYECNSFEVKDDLKFFEMVDCSSSVSDLRTSLFGFVVVGADRSRVFGKRG